MVKRKSVDVAPKLLIDIKGLQETLSVGQAVAKRVGEESGAKVKLGRRTLYNVEKLQEYLYEQTVK